MQSEGLLGKNFLLNSIFCLILSLITNINKATFHSLLSMVYIDPFKAWGRLLDILYSILTSGLFNFHIHLLVLWLLANFNLADSLKTPTKSLYWWEHSSIVGTFCGDIVNFFTSATWAVSDMCINHCLEEGVCNCKVCSSTHSELFLQPFLYQIHVHHV